MRPKDKIFSGIWEFPDGKIEVKEEPKRAFGKRVIDDPKLDSNSREVI